MIRVTAQPEPATFNALVRTPGQEFLRTEKRPIKSFPRLWKNCMIDLRGAYSGICAYSARKIAVDQTHSTIDHFVPKNAAPNLAYEWNNYRLCAEKFNKYKADAQDVLDPFIIQNGWFVLNFKTFLVEAAPGLCAAITNNIQASIARLRLNDDDDCVQERCNITGDYARGDVSFAFLERNYPFIAIELTRQGMVNSIKAQHRGLTP